MMKQAVNRPAVVTGKKSPEPTVVTVTADHHSDSPRVWMLDPGTWRQADTR